MPSAVQLAQQIESLLAESEAMEDRLSRWQAGEAPEQTEIRRAQRDYQSWYGRATRLVPDQDRPRFRDMYEGGSFIKRIRAFLADPLAPSPLHDAAAPSPLVDPWQHSFASTCRDGLSAQRDILAAALEQHAGPAAVLDELAAVFSRLPEMLVPLPATFAVVGDTPDKIRGWGR